MKPCVCGHRKSKHFFGVCMADDGEEMCTCETFREAKE